MGHHPRALGQAVVELLQEDEIEAADGTELGLLACGFRLGDCPVLVLGLYVDEVERTFDAVERGARVLCDELTASVFSSFLKFARALLTISSSTSMPTIRSAA